MSKSFDLGLSEEEYEGEQAAAFAERGPSPISNEARAQLLATDLWDETTAISTVFGIQPHPRIWPWAERMSGASPLAARMLRARAALIASDLRRKNGQFLRDEFLRRVQTDYESGNPFGYDPAVLAALRIELQQQKIAERTRKIEHLQRTVAYLVLIHQAQQNDLKTGKRATTEKLADLIVQLRGPGTKKAKPVSIGYKTLENDLSAGLELLREEWPDKRPVWKLDGKALGFRTKG